jgi:simple sugar transport system permease protein
MTTPPLSENLAVPQSEPAPREKSALARTFEQIISAREFGPFILLSVLIIVFSLSAPAFLSARNLTNILAFTPELGIIALGMTMLLISGEFDLSVGSIFGFCPVLMFTLFNQGVMPIEAAFVVSLVVAALFGLFSGIMVTKVKISSFLVTLSMLLIVRGIALYITNGFPSRTWNAETPFTNLLIGTIQPAEGGITIYASLIWFILFAVILNYVLVGTKFGNWVRATGGNSNAAKARGVNIDRTRIVLFVLSAILAGFAGIINAFRTSSANPNNGTGYELEVIAMVVIGGTSLYGGSGTIIGTIIGVFILRLMRNGIIMVGVPGLAYDAFIGIIILAMMSLHAFVERRNRSGG